MNHETDDPDRSAAPPREDSGDTMVFNAADLARLKAEVHETRSVSSAELQAAIPTQPFEQERLDAIKEASRQASRDLPLVLGRAPRGSASGDTL